MKTKSVHLVKIQPEFFDKIYRGEKTFEVRINDRNYRAGDEMILQEWNHVNKMYTGRLFCVDIHYVLEGGQFGILPGYVVMSIERISGAELNIDNPPGHKFEKLLNEHD